MEKIIAAWGNLSADTKKKIEHLIKFDELSRQYMEELHTRPCYRDFFDHYNEESVHAFIREYAARKAYYTLEGETKVHEESEARLQFRHHAERYFAEIQQKKLFDLQCLWRAGKINLDGIRFTSDFDMLEHCIFSVPFLNPVTRHELNIYLDYLATEEDINSHEHRWQDFTSFKMAFDSGQWNRIPKWYQFYDKALGMESLLQEKDIRGEEESRWLNKHCRSDEKITYPEVNEKPELEFNYNTLEFFVYTFEDRKIIRQFMATERFHPEIDENKLLHDSWKMLRESDEEINISKTGNWKTALIETADRYRKQKTAECLNDLFKEYQLRLKAGIPIRYGENDALFEYYSVKANLYSRKLTEAKSAAGNKPD